MITDLLRWVAPGAATVVAGTALCVAMTSANIASDIQSRGADALLQSGYAWAELGTDMRDVSLTGTTSDARERDAALAQLGALNGVRSVAADVTLAPLAQPYQLVASVEDGAIKLSGAVPDIQTRQRLETLAGVTSSNLELHSGMPARNAWVSGAEYAIAQLKYLDAGQIALADLDLEIAGRAKSERDYRDLQIVLRAGAPLGTTLGHAAVTPALATPYQWSAEYDGKRIAVSGFVPNDQLAERIQTADVAGIPVATGLRLASGEPEGFAELSDTLIRQLAKLEYGTATISDTHSTLTGAPATSEIAQSVRTELAQTGSIVTLDLPRIADYWVSATLHADGTIVFDGYAPDEATKQALAAFTGADTNWLKLGRGAPDRYRSAVDFGMSALAFLSEGRFSLRDNVVTLSGTARSGADFTALQKLINAGSPQGVVLAQAEISAPAVQVFSWSATKAADGTITLAGFVPSAADADMLRTAAGQRVKDSQTLASGAPAGFVASAQTAMALLQQLQNGKIAFDGSAWTITGTPNSSADQTAIEATFASRQLAASGWSMSLAQPLAVATAPVIEPTAPAEPPVPAEPQAPVAPVQPQPTTPAAEPTPPAQPAAAAVDPDYMFAATRANGAVVLIGHVPTALADAIFDTVPDASTDAVTFAEGAPADFLDNAKTGLAALATLEEGKLEFAQGRWTLSGTATSDASNVQLAATIAALPSASEWSVKTTAPQPIAPSPAPTATAPTSAPVNIAACRDVLAEFSARNSILFQSGAAILATASEPAIDELATDLAACPDAVVHVEGHTDSDGDDALNLALSVARAEAVVDALIARGVTPERLYAVGYGESRPIADNATAAGKQLNRRIVITVLDQHY